MERGARPSRGADMSEIDGITQGRVLAGRFRIDRLRGRGGFGAVWQADDAVLGRPVAVKVLAASLREDAASRERFRREALAAAKLAHPRIASVFDYGEHDGIPFIVMELLSGETLTRRLWREKTLPPATAAEIGAQVAEALAAAHRAGVVHRDVKPDNVWLLASGGVKVLDFGLASAAWAPTVTHPDMLVGTPTYLPPERAAGAAGDGSSDVYSLGVVLYETLAGRPPFAGPNALALVNAHATQTPAPLEEAGVPRALARLVTAALAKDPTARPGADALAGRLREAAAGSSRGPDLGRLAAAVRRARGSGRTQKPAAAAAVSQSPGSVSSPDSSATASGSRTVAAVPPSGQPEPTTVLDRGRPGHDTAGGSGRGLGLGLSLGPDRRGQAAAVGAAVALFAIVVAVAWPRGQPAREAVAPSTTAPPVSAGPTTTASSLPRAFGDSAVSGLVDEVFSAVESGLAGGDVRDDVAVDLGNLLGNLEREAADGSRRELIDEVDDLALKVQTRVREGGISPERAAEIQTRLQVLRAALASGGGPASPAD